MTEYRGFAIEFFVSAIDGSTRYIATSTEHQRVIHWETLADAQEKVDEWYKSR